MKHIPVKYLSLKEFEVNGDVRLEYVQLEDNGADIFTKPPLKNKYEVLINLHNIFGKISKYEC